jgi:hypothetical protein
MNPLPVDVGGMPQIPQMLPVQPDGLMEPMPEAPPVPVVEEPVIRGSLEDWAGGKSIKLDKKLKSGKTVREELSQHLKEVLDLEIQNQARLLARLKRWGKLYKAEGRGARPKPWMADVSIPLARKISDAIYVRIMDMVFNKRKIVLFKPKSEVSPAENDKIKIQERAFNNYVINDLNLKEKMKFPTRQTVNSGTGVVKIVYETKNKTIYRYSSDEEKINPAVKKYRLPGTKDTVVKEPSIVFRGPNVYPVDRAKWIISSDALNIEDSYICGFSFERRKKQLEVLGKKGVYYQDAVDKLSPTKMDATAEERANAAGRDTQTTRYTEPYQLWELWLRYDVDDDGEEDDICVTFHRESGQILKAIYNPIFYSYRPFVDFKGASQVEYTYDGEGICEIIEPLSEEIDTLHNLMLDRMKLINLPIRLYQTGIGIESKDLEPGKDIAVDVDPTTAMYTVPDKDVTFSIVNEVNWLISQADIVCGITPASLGISTAERPVAKETIAMQEETNKKFKSWTDNFRSGYREMFYKLLEAFSQYQPTYTYTDEMGQVQEVSMPTGNIRDYLEIDLEVSSEAMNQEVRREVELMKYQLISDFATKVGGMAQLLANPQVPSEFKKFILYVNDIGSRAVERVMSNFDETEAGQSTIDMKKGMDVQKCVAMSVDLMPPPGTPLPGQPGQGGPPQPPGPMPEGEQLVGMP